MDVPVTSSMGLWTEHMRLQHSWILAAFEGMVWGPSFVVIHVSASTSTSPGVLCASCYVPRPTPCSVVTAATMPTAEHALGYPVVEGQIHRPTAMLITSSLLPLLPLPLQNQAFQQGGMFVFDGTKCIWSHYDQATGDHADFEEVLKVATGSSSANVSAQRTAATASAKAGADCGCDS
eukprot:GHRR01020433.1.p1 GENE.GHRR01020433.1~~GHRR01020433.1.p1  ORF type:complete len:178 (+),score=37.96 GHRR01020433.1:1066-1599(+)